MQPLFRCVHGRPEVLSLAGSVWHRHETTARVYRCHYLMPPVWTPGCLDEDVVLAFVNGSLEADALARVERHLATCRDCSWLVTAAVLVREDDLQSAVASSVSRSSIPGRPVAGPVAGGPAPSSA